MSASPLTRMLNEGALSFLELAREEADQGYARKDFRRVRDAAEKSWLAAIHATDAAMARHGAGPEVGPPAHFARENFLERVGRRDLADELRLFANRLHGDIFYLGAVPDAAHLTALLDEVETYVRRVAEEV